MSGGGGANTKSRRSRVWGQDRRPHTRLRGRRETQPGIAFKRISKSDWPLVLTVEDAADRLGVGRTVMYALVSSGAVESVRIGRLRRVPADALVGFLDALRDCQRGGAA